MSKKKRKSENINNKYKDNQGDYAFRGDINQQAQQAQKNQQINNTGINNLLEMFMGMKNNTNNENKNVEINEDLKNAIEVLKKADRSQLMSVFESLMKSDK